jgi:DNA-binding XRE family transcriptional regulator
MKQDKVEARIGGADDIKAEINKDPARRARVDAMKKAMRTGADVGMALGKLRFERSMVQVTVAEALGTSQANVSRIEHERDPYLSTLKGYIEALGGRLEMLAVFPEVTIQIALPGTGTAK